MNNFAHIVSNLLKEEANPFKGDKKDPHELKNFTTTRAAGAVKIQNAAEKKGGYSLLTYVHFKAKEIPYKKALEHIEDEDSSFLEKSADECFDKLKDWKKMTQREFQAVMGQLEAYGEVYLRSVQSKGV